MKRVNIKASKAVWMSKLAKSKNFIVVTDKESAMRLNIDADMDGIIKLASQRSSLDGFRNTLSDAIDELDKQLDEALGDGSPVTHIPVKQVKSEGVKIPVKKQRKNKKVS